MDFVDRREELERLERLARRPGGGLAALWGRRRVGKTRILLEWCRGGRGIYTVADRSAEPVQRRYMAEAVSEVFPGFGAVGYPDWRTLLDALARAAAVEGWRGPLVLDELPYLVEACPSLPSVLQRWLDHEAAAAGVAVAVAGSAQHMMQGLVLDASAPLFGRAVEAMRVRPLALPYLGRALGLEDPVEVVAAYSIWGGVPRYWELAEPYGEDLAAAVDDLMLSPLGPLHMEPDRVLSAEIPSAVPLGPVLDAIGAGAHRGVEIGGRIGQPSTSLSRPLGRLVEIDLVRREQPLGEPERRGRRTLYRIADPLLRAWFRLVAPRRAALARADRASRLRLFERHAPALAAEAFEGLCREAVPALGGRVEAAGSLRGFGVATRTWDRSGPEWDVAAVDDEGKRLLLGEAKWRERPADAAFVRRSLGELRAKGRPQGKAFADHEVVRALFVPALTPAARKVHYDGLVLTAEDLCAALE